MLLGMWPDRGVMDEVGVLPGGFLGWAMVAHTFDLSIWEAEADEPL